MKLSKSIAATALCFAAASADGNVDAFAPLKKWLVAEGAQVNSALQGNLTHHGGANIRGVIATKALKGNYEATLFEVPKKMWLLLGNFPEFEKSMLPSTNECNDLADWEAYRIKLGSAIAAESKKGKKSYHFSHIASLPSMDDFRSFLPRLMKPALLQEFAPLPLVATAKEQQSYDADYNRVCFEQWKKTPSCPAADITWGELELALMWIRTRCYGTDSGTAVIPGTDMLNAAKASELNTYWSYTKDAFFLHTKIEDVKAGSELYESYCQDCDNSAMLRIWGVYVEDNPNPVEANKVNCATAGLRESVEGALEAKPASTEWRSPRCKASVFKDSQGPIKCSLARLSWEYCASTWGLADPSHRAASLLARGAVQSLSPREDAKLISRSAIGDVPKALRRSRAWKTQGAVLN